MAGFIVSDGQTSSSLTLSSGDHGIVLGGGTAVSITALGGGQIEILSGGRGSGTVVNGGSAVLLGGTDSGTMVSNGGSELVGSGGVAIATSVGSGGAQTVGAGGTATFAQVGSSGSQTVFGSANETTLNGGNAFVAPGGIASGTVIRNGAAEIISSGGIDSFAVISRGGVQLVTGSANFTTISAGGSQRVSSGGGVVGAAILNGGAQTLLRGGVAAFTLVSGFSGYQYISAGGIASGTALYGASHDIVSSGGLSISTTMAPGGIDSEVVASGGTASNTNLGIANFQYVFFGGVAVSATIGATSIAFVSGLASATQIGSGGAVRVASGAAANFTQISSGGYLVVSAGGNASATSVLSGGTEVIFAGALVGGTTLSAGGTIDLRELVYVSGGSADLAAGVLTVKQGVASYKQMLSGSYTGEYFHALPDGLGGTAVVMNGTPCYCRGTRILTDHGEIAVERLRIGDRLITHTGAARPLIWIGQRSFPQHVASGDPELLPVHIRAGALADNVPQRDLLVSPRHAIFLENLLIPAAALINGTSIVQIEVTGRLDYFHLELDSHDIIIAEGALSESFIDDESRAMFDNADTYDDLYPHTMRRRARYCAPRVEGGEILETIRRDLAARVPATTPRQVDVPPRQGRLDLVERARICGWAHDATAPDRPVRLCLFDNGVALGDVVADRYRPDLAANGYGTGCHAFEMIVPGGLSPSIRHVIDARCADTAQPLPGSPQILEATALVADGIAARPRAIDRDEPQCGRLDVVTRDRVAGWAQDPAQPDIPVALQILDNSTLIAQVLANCYRPDLAAAGIGQGWHSFDVTLPGGLSALSRHVIEVRRERDGALLGEPTVIEAANSFDASLEHSIAQAVAAVAVSGESERVLSFMLSQTEQLLQQRADHEAQREARRVSVQTRHRLGPQVTGVEPVRRALVVDQRVPDPRRDGGSAAILSHMRALQHLGYSVSFAAAGEMTVTPASLIEAGIMPCCAPYYTSVEDVLRRQAGCFDVVYLHRVDMAARYLALARNYVPRARILYGVADLNHLRLARQAAVEEQPQLLAVSRRLRLAECTAAWSADAVISHSPAEVAMLQNAVPEARVYHVPWDVLPHISGTTFADRDGLALIGHYGHAPNVDAAQYLVDVIMPLVWQTDPQITCRLVGSEITPAVRRLERPGIIVMAQVDDLPRDVLDRVRLTVAPLRYGAGIKAKVLDSFAAGVPCVMSEIAAEGLALSAELRRCVSDDAAGLAALICRLHAEEAAHRAASAAVRSLIGAHFTADRVVSALQAAIDDRAVTAQASMIRTADRPRRRRVRHATGSHHSVSPSL